MAKELQKYSSPDDGMGKSGIFPRAEKSNFSCTSVFFTIQATDGELFSVLVFSPVTGVLLYCYLCWLLWLYFCVWYNLR